MNAAAVFALIEKGLTLVPLLINAGQEVIPLINRIREIAKGGATGTISADELTALEADLDAALEDFNKPIE